MLTISARNDEHLKLGDCVLILEEEKKKNLPVSSSRIVKYLVFLTSSMICLIIILPMTSMNWFCTIFEMYVTFLSHNFKCSCNTWSSDSIR